MLTTEALIQRLNVLRDERDTTLEVRTLPFRLRRPVGSTAKHKGLPLNGATDVRWARFCWLHASAAWIRSWHAYLLAAVPSEARPDGGASWHATGAPMSEARGAIARVRLGCRPLLGRGLVLGTAVGAVGCNRPAPADTSVLDIEDVAHSDASGVACNVGDWVDEGFGLEVMEQELGLSAWELMSNVAGLWTGRAARYRATVDEDDYERAPMTIDIEEPMSARVGYPHAGADFAAPGCFFTVRSGGPATLLLANFGVAGRAELSVSCDTADCAARVIAQVLWARADATGDEWAAPEADLYALSGRLDNGRWSDGRTSWAFEVSVGGSPAMAFRPHLVGWWVREEGTP